MHSKIRDLTHPVVDFDKVFSGRIKFRHGEYVSSIKRKKLPSLVLPSGRVIVGDPGYLDRTESLERLVAPGKYPVQIAIRVDRLQDDIGVLNEIACGKVTFLEAPVTEWVLATTPGQDPATLKALDCFGCGLDRSSIFCFADAVGVRNFVEGKEETGNTLLDAVLAARQDPFADLILDESNGANLVQTLAGQGNGPTAIFWGLGKKGQIACLVTDFGCLSEYANQTQTIGKVNELVGQPQTLPTPCGDLMVEIKRFDRKRKIEVVIDGPKLNWVQCEIRSNEKKLQPKGGKTSCGQKLICEMEFAKDLPDDAVCVVSYLDRIESYVSPE